MFLPIESYFWGKELLADMELRSLEETMGVTCTQLKIIITSQSLLEEE